MGAIKLALNVSETAALIGVSRTTIYTMVKNMEIPHARVRSRIIFHSEVIESWLKGEIPVTRKGETDNGAR